MLVVLEFKSSLGNEGLRGSPPVLDVRIEGRRIDLVMLCYE